MVAPNYANTRAELAKKIGLGRKLKAAQAVADTAVPATDALKGARKRVNRKAEAVQD